MAKRFGILAVDDDPINIKLIKSVLGKDYDVLTALNGHDAIDQIEEQNPDLILLDVMMPTLDGFDLCRIIKADRRFADIPIIFLTGLDSQEGARRGLELGGIDYLTKPVDFDLLKLRVRNHLAMKEQRDQLARQKEELGQLLAEKELQNEQMRATRAALQLIENRQAKMIANISDVITIVDQEGINRYKSPNVEKWFGWTPEELVGRSVWENVHPEDLAPAQSFFDTLTSEPEAFGTTECRYQCKDGSYRWIEVAWKNLLHDPEIQGILGDYHDITARKCFEEERQKLEKQFQQAQKMESLGVLASGIAHDFNNILSIIMGSCFLGLESVEAAEGHFCRIEAAAVRGAELCNQMLAYAGKSQNPLNQVNLGLQVEELTKMLQVSTPPSVAIRLDMAADIPCVVGDPGQVDQVIMNLIINAVDAIGEAQGEIHIRLDEVVCSAADAEKDYLGKEIAAGTYVCLEVADNGCGMSEEIKKRLFEPFYTTKFTGRGLGLSATLGIIKSHNGALQLTSQLGQGTTFKVYLPVPSSEAGRDDDEPCPPVVAAPWRGSGTILLVDDEETILLAVSAMLKILGFTVIKAGDGNEALELYQEHAGEIDLVLSDMGMPVMNGYELVQELKKIDGDLPIIVSSGFGEIDVTAGIAEGAVAAILNKPYHFEQLRVVLKDVTENVPARQA